MGPCILPSFVIIFLTSQIKHIILGLLVAIYPCNKQGKSLLSFEIKVDAEIALSRSYTVENKTLLDIHLLNQSGNNGLDLLFKLNHNVFWCGFSILCEVQTFCKL